MRCPWLLDRILSTLALTAMLNGTATDAQIRPTAPEIHHIHGLAVDRLDPEALSIATHTGLVRVRPGAAPEWIGSHRFDLMGFTAHPRDGKLVYASGHPDLAAYQALRTGHLGLVVSRDGGRTWQPVALKGKADFHALTYSPRDGGQLYGWSVAEETGLYRISAVTWAVERLPARGLAGVLALAASPDAAGPLLAGTTAGLHASRDQGVTWVLVTALPADVPVTVVSHHSADPSVIYAYAARPDLGLVRSKDGGTTWGPTGFAADARSPVVALTVGPGDHVVIATGHADVLRSRDGGRTWERVLDRGRPVGSPR